MKVIELGVGARQVERYGSVGFTVSHLARAQDSSVACLRLVPGGLIGRHEAVRRQLFAVVVGDALVSGADGVEQPIAAGQAVVWEPGEMHETRSVNGFTALVIEGDIALAH